MIEIIREEQWDLPKNIRQIGNLDEGDRIYMEGVAYQTMHSYARKPGKTVYIMLGHCDEFAERTCIFIESVIEMTEISFNGSWPVWGEESWGILYKKLQPEHEKMIIVGWAIDVYGEYPHMTAQLEHVHQKYFGGVHQVLLLLDSVEQEEYFYSNRNGYLKRREGFYIYYDKQMAKPTIYPEKNPFEEKRREESYRAYLNQRTSAKKEGGSYGLTLLLLASVVALGYSAFQNYQKMSQMQQAIQNMNQLQETRTTEYIQEIISVEDVAGIIEPLPTERAESETEIKPESEPEPETAIETQYYIVQKGESLAAICRKLYQTTDRMDEICALNHIDNPDSIYEGQYLELPK